MKCKKNEKWKWKIFFYHEKELRDWDVKSYEEIEKMLFRWEINSERQTKVNEFAN